MTLAERPHPFPSRTRKLSSPAPKILRGQPFGKIGRRQDFCVSGRVPFAGPAGIGDRPAAVSCLRDRADPSRTPGPRARCAPRGAAARGRRRGALSVPASSVGGRWRGVRAVARPPVRGRVAAGVRCRPRSSGGPAWGRRTATLPGLPRGGSLRQGRPALPRVALSSRTAPVVVERAAGSACLPASASSGNSAAGSSRRSSSLRAVGAFLVARGPAVAGSGASPAPSASAVAAPSDADARHDPVAPTPVATPAPSADPRRDAGRHAEAEPDAPSRGHTGPAGRHAERDRCEVRHHDGVLARLNGITNPRLIRVGQVLKLP